MSEKILVKVNGEWTDDPGALAASLAAMAAKEELQAKLIAALEAEIARLREERKPVGWCVQAAEGSMVHAGNHSPIDAAFLIQVKDEAEARMLSAVFGHRVLAIVEADAKGDCDVPIQK